MPYPTIELTIWSVIALAVALAVGTGIARLGFPLPPPERRLGCVDGLRGFLALSVLLHHFIVWLQVDRLGQPWGALSLNAFSSLGSGAVALFFMATGFVFYPRVLAGFGKTDWRTTFVGRVFRLLPLIVASIAAITIILLIRQHFQVQADPGAYAIAALQWLTSLGEPPLLGVPDSGRLNAYVLWSLGYEWAFYLLILPLCAFIRDRLPKSMPSWWLPAGLFIVTLAMRPLANALPLIRYLPLFAIGMLAFEVQARPEIAQRLRGWPVACAAVLALALGMTTSPWPYGPVQLVLYGLFFTAVAAGNSIFGVLRLRGALVLGDCSYGIYLIHGTVLSVLFTDLNGFERLLPTAYLPMLLPAVAAAVVIIASLAHLGIERPGIRLGKQLAKTWHARLSGPVADVAP